jgi:uroporphyrinogen decarboxylase
MRDSMTPKERVMALMSGQPMDRFPCVPLILNHAARVLGCTLGEYAVNGRIMAEAHVAAFRRYRHDMICIFSDTAVLAEALGTRLHFPEDDVPRFESPAVAEPQDAARLAPADARTSGRLPVMLEAIRRCVGEVGDEVLVACCYPAPFSTAAALRGTALFARDLYKHPAEAHVLLDKSLQLVLDFAGAVAEAGGVPVLVDPVASGSVISPRAFREFALPPLKTTLAEIRRLGFPPMLHICGRTAGIIEMMADAGADVLSVDQIDLAEARRLTADRVCLMGNVRPAETLLGGTPEAVRAEALGCLQACADSPRGFVLASGCEVPVETPPENVHALIEAAREVRVA